MIILHKKLMVQILCVFIFSTAKSDPIDYSDCGSKYKIKSLDIEGCKVIPCEIKIGTSYNVKFTFQPTYRTEYLSQEAYITLFNINFPLVILPNDPCASLNCPLLGSDDVTFNGKIIIEENAVPSKGQLWWKMTDRFGQSALCIKTSVQVEERNYTFDVVKLFFDLVFD